MSVEPAVPAALFEGAFVGYESLRAHLREGLQAAAAQGWRELLLCDADFQIWPLGEGAVLQALQVWARGGGRLTMLAKTYSEVPRCHPRFVQWRQQWAHQIDCRVCREADALQLPCALWSPFWALHRLEPLRHGGLCGSDPAFRTALREQIGHWLTRSVAGFPAYTLGL